MKNNSEENFGFEVKIIEDSISEDSRLTTYQLKYPRFIHSELMTHRVFSRNASSSRAIPVKKMLEMVREEPACPIHWGMNQAGMQAEQELNDDDKKKAYQLWRDAATTASTLAELMQTLNVHKQVVNRILEPFQFINVVLTSTEFDNFFELRSHEDAQPEIKLLSDMMLELYNTHKPKQLLVDEFHLPYIKDEEREKYHVSDLVKFSTSRCARVSYLTHDKKEPSPENDLKLYDRLVGSNPIHASPCEHQARVAKGTVFACDGSFSGNFSKQWLQHRKFVERGERILQEFAYTVKDKK